MEPIISLRPAHPRVMPPYLAVRTALMFLLGIGLPTNAADSPLPGQQLYQTLCVDCHGAQGEGVDDAYAEPLQGDRSLDDLTKIIDETMPEDDPQQCSGAQAREVAQYIYDAFYSAAAQERNRPARIELARLTVPQYQNAIADLMVDFWGQGRASEQRGIQGRYFRSRGFRDREQAMERIDPQIEFQFGAESPGADIPAEEFSIRWEGGLVADDSGDYDFRLVTENGARLWINDPQTPLIDAWVRSGDQKEYEATRRLLAGRVYPLRLDHFKFKDTTASVELQWRPPHGGWQVIPQRNLTPGRFPRTMVVETDFPADDSSVGYERGTTVSAGWDQATTRAAIEIAGKVVDQLESLSGCKPDAPDRTERLRAFCYRFAERAFRRPLSAEQQKFFVDDMFDSTEDVELAVKQVVLLVLKSPRFLYVGIGHDPPDEYDVAEHLSFALWDSLPDRELLEAAAEKRLQSDDKVLYQANRMLTDPRTRAKLRQFLHRWLKVDHVEAIQKDTDVYPGFEPALVSDLRSSLDLFLDDIVWGTQPDFRRLLLSSELFVSPRLASFYALSAPERIATPDRDPAGTNGASDEQSEGATSHPAGEQAFVKVALDPQQGAGVLTHPYLLANLSYHKTTSPIHRGVFVIRSLLGRSLKPPPIAVTPLDESFDPSMTTRERVTFQTRPANCQTCHELINPFGFSLEHYDAVGRFRATEKQKPINASGTYETIAGQVIQFDGARQLAEFLAASEETHRWFVEQLFHHVVKQPVEAYGPGQLGELTQSFANEEYNLQRLLVQIVRVTALHTSSR